MSDEKQLALNSINIINEIKTNRNHVHKLEISYSGRQPVWKTIMICNTYTKQRQNLSEGFRTWREVRVYLSGIRIALTQL